MVQTGFKAEEHCWKCFKENRDIGFIDDKAINLCKGCLYVVKQMSQWLNAYGLGIRQVIAFSAEEAQDQIEDLTRDGKKRVSRGKKGPEEAEAGVIDPDTFEPAV